MEKKSKNDLTIKIIFLVIVVVALASIVLIGVRKHVSLSKLSTQSFNKIAVDNNYRVKELDTSIDNVVTWTRGYSDVNEITMDFVECKSPAAANSFYADQKEAISTYETTNEKGSSTGTVYTLSASGYYYYLKKDGNFVILVTGKSEHSSEISGFIAKLPSAK